MFDALSLKIRTRFPSFGKLPFFLSIVMIASLPYVFYLNKGQSQPSDEGHLTAFDEISELMQLEFRFQKLFDAVNAYRISPSDGVRKDIEFHREILRIHTTDDLATTLGRDEYAGSNALTVINSTPQMVELISEEIDLFLATGDAEIGRRLAEKIQSYLFEFHSELMFLSDMSNQIARRQEMALAASVQRDFSVLFLINVLMVIVLSVFSYALASKERKLVERTKEVAASEQKSEAKTRYLASMSHEIRTPMQGIIGLTQILGQTDLDDNQRRNLGLIATSATTLLGILNDILDIAKIEAEKMELAPSPIELRKTVEEVIQLSGSIAKEKDVDLEFSFSPHLPDRILADGTRLKQVLLNLSSNAIKFCSGQANGKRGKVTVKFEAREPGRVYFKIEDNGIGMPPDVLGRLFTPYTQASRDTSKRFGGTGLGLTITKQIVDLMSGTIHVESKVGAGSTFSVDIPIKEISAQSDKVDLKGKLVLSLLTDETYAINIAGHVNAAGGVYRKEKEFDPILDQLFSSDIRPAILLGLPRALQLASQIDRVKDTFPNTHFVVLAERVVTRDELPANCSVVDASPLLPSVLLEEIATDLHGIGASGLRTPAQAEPPKAESPQHATVTKLRPITTPATKPTEDKVKDARGRILVAEDNQINQMVIQTQLRKMGYDVTIVDDGEQALNTWRKTQDFDVILSDCNMPVMDGLEFARMLRQEQAQQDCPRTPLIALTADAFEQQRLECMEAGMDDFLVKPTSVEQLSEKLEYWLRQSGKSGQNSQAG